MDDADWTVMVLMGANNLGNEADLTDFADADIQEMRKVGSKQGHLNILVQIDPNPNADDPRPRRFKVKKNGNGEAPEYLDPKDSSSGDPDVLEEFIRWGKSHKAKRYLLVIWGHAWRFAFVRDGRDALDFTKLSDILALTKENKNIDIVAFDSCGVGWIEAAYQLRNVADYLVATQFTDPLPGWPYTEILERMTDDSAGMSPEDLGRLIVSQFVQHYDRYAERYTDESARGFYDESATTTMTALDLKQVQEIGDRIKDLAIAVAMAIQSTPGELERVDDALQRSEVPIKEPAVDLTTLCWNLFHFCETREVRDAALAVGDLLLKPTNPFIVAHARSDLTVATLQGVSIFAPSVRPSFDSKTLRPLYEELALSQETLWDELAYTLAEPD